MEIRCRCKKNVMNFVHLKPSDIPGGWTCPECDKVEVEEVLPAFPKEVKPLCKDSLPKEEPVKPKPRKGRPKNLTLPGEVKPK
jgi:hypothetical protein